VCYAKPSKIITSIDGVLHKNDQTQEGIESSLSNFHFFLTQEKAKKQASTENHSIQKATPISLHFTSLHFISLLLQTTC